MTEFEEQQAVTAPRSPALERPGSVPLAAEQRSAFPSLKIRPRAGNFVHHDLRASHGVTVYRCAAKIPSFNPVRRFAPGVAVLGMCAYFG